MPVYCLDPLVIEHTSLGIVPDDRARLLYPIYFTSNSNFSITVEAIHVESSSGCVKLLNSPQDRNVLSPQERAVHLCSVVVFACKKQSYKNHFSMSVRYQTGNQSEKYFVSKNYTYMEMHGVVTVGEHQNYDVRKLPHSYNETERTRLFNYSITNKMTIPLRFEKVYFNAQVYSMHWFRHNGGYIYPNQSKEEMLLEYRGERNLTQSPNNYIVTIEFNGGIFVPI